MWSDEYLYKISLTSSDQSMISLASKYVCLILTQVRIKCLLLITFFIHRGKDFSASNQKLSLYSIFHGWEAAASFLNTVDEMKITQMWISKFEIIIISTTQYLKHHFHLIYLVM